MKKEYISDVWQLKQKGHENFEFVDVAVNDDNLLFIDPCLIERWNNAWAIKTSLDKGTQRKTTENELPSLTQCTA